MFFLKQGKTNWKYIIIVLFIAAGAGWLIFYYMGQLSFLTTTVPLSEIKQSEKIVDMADWNTYKSERFGYEFQYPKNLSVSVDQKNIESGHRFQQEYISILGDSEVDFSLDVYSNSQDDAKSEAGLFYGRYGNPVEPFFVNGVEGAKISGEEARGVSTGTRIFIIHRGIKYSICFFSKNKEKIPLYNKIASTFRFIEIPTKYMADEQKYSEVINKVIPSNFNRDDADYCFGDLNGDGQSEMIITAFSFSADPGYSPGDAYLVLLSSADDKGNYEKIGEFNFYDYTFSRPGAIPWVEKFEDIDNDKQNEIIISLGFGGATTLAEGIIEWNSSTQKMDWVKLQDEHGNAEKAIFFVGASVMHSSGYNVDIDMDQDGNKEIVELYSEREYTEPVDLKPWEKAAPELKNSSGDEDGMWGWKYQSKVYEWDGMFFSYSEELTKKSLTTK